MLEAASILKAPIFAPTSKNILFFLSLLKNVYCYPKTNEEWKKINIDSYGLGLMWSSRFEVHVDQVIALASKVEPIKKASHA